MDEQKKDAGDRAREIGRTINTKASDLEKLGQKIPRFVRTLRVEAEAMNYIGGELDRISSDQPARWPELSGVVQPLFDAVQNSLQWEIPDPSVVENTISMVSSANATTTSSTYSIVRPFALDREPYFSKLPDILKPLTVLDEICNQLESLKNGLGATWRAARECLSVRRVDAIKSAAVNARTVMDEVSWLAPEDVLRRLPWCRFDEKNRPTRASRFAWIQFGDHLPLCLQDQPQQDARWRAINEAYERLHKYVHVVEATAESFVDIEVQLNALELYLGQYLTGGLHRLSKSEGADRQ